MRLAQRLKLYWEFSRPFTLLAPALGMLSGGVTAFGAYPRTAFSWEVLWKVALGTVMAGTLNAASNGLNQYHDAQIDRFNKPHRPIPSGRLPMKEAAYFTAFLFVAALGMAFGVNIECGLLAFGATVFTYLYSAPPVRTKRLGALANLTIAIPRGVLLKVAGWSTVKTVLGVEPWFIGLIFGTFLLGATSTKDFADMKGDALGGCMTLPVRYGVRTSAYMISPFFVLPFFLMPIGVRAGILTGNGILLTILGFFLSLWGLYVSYLMLRKPEELVGNENHISWTYMYLMMFTAQVSFIVAYLV